MTVAFAPRAAPAAPAAATPAPGGGVRVLRRWDVAVLVALLGAIAAVVGPGLYTVDEGAYTAQARWVDEGGPWIQPFTVPDLGPGPEPAPLALSTITDDGWAAFAKAPAYVWALVGARQLHPGWGPVGASAAGLVAAAIVAARLAERTVPSSGRLAFWLVGATSPLLVHASIVWAHTLAAATCLGAVLGMATILDPTRQGAAAARAVPVVATVATMAAAVALRSEAVLLAPAAALVLGVEFVRHRRPRALVAAGAAVVGAVAGHLGNDLLVARAVGPSAPSRIPAGRGFDLVERLHSAWNNLLAPGGAVDATSLARLVSVVVLGFVAAKVGGSGPVERRPLRVLAVTGAATGLVGAAGLAPYHGLAPSVPLLVVGVVAALRADCRPAARRLLAIAAAHAAAVVAISEPTGGGLGWGGRYVVVAAVVVAPVAAVGLLQLLRSARQPGSTARWLLVAAVVATGAVQLAGIRALDRAHAGSRTVAPQLAVDLVELGARDQLLLTTDLRVGRAAADTARRLPLLSVPDDQVAGTLQRIVDADLDAPLAVTLRGARWPSVPDGWRLGPIEALGVLDVAPLEQTG